MMPVTFVTKDFHESCRAITWRLRWRFKSGQNGRHTIHINVSELGGNRDVAERVANQLKAHIEAAQDCTNKSEFLAVLQGLIVAERDALASSQASDHRAGGGGVSQPAGGSVIIHDSVKRRKRVVEDSNKAQSAEGATTNKSIKRTVADSNSLAKLAGEIDSASANEDKVLLLQMRRPHYDAIKDERKKWEARPVFRTVRSGWQQTIFDKLATVGRTVVLQSGAGTNDRMQISEVRRYIADEDVGLHALRNMVRELGTDLLPDTVGEEARIEVYKSIYGELQCSKGFVAMRMQLPAQGQPSTNMRVKQRACNSAGGCGSIMCDSCYPPGDRLKKRH
jgi:hypothetical protein